MQPDIASRIFSSTYSMEIIGLLPVAGEATRIQPIPVSKALLPVGYRTLPDDTVRPKVIAHYLLDQYRLGGASKAYFILNKGKWDIPGYFGDGFAQDIALDLAYLMVGETYGTPYTLNRAYSFIKDAIVLLGFPDILYKPDGIFKRLVYQLIEEDADMVVGLYPISDPRQAQGSDMVLTGAKGELLEIHIKPKETQLTHAWTIAAWKPRFSTYMDDYLRRDLVQRRAEPAMKEIFVGHIVQAALRDGFNILTETFNEGSFLDIGTPAGWQQAYKLYS